MFGWVDFSDSERKRAAEVLELVKLPGAIDELGIGVLRDGFANVLFPGTSTLHTHARYYFLIAYLMKDLERYHAGRPIEAVRRAYEQGEKETARKLLAWCDANGRKKTGITGSDFVNTDRWVKQTPTSMDWATIQSYGLLDDPSLKLGSFLQLVASSKRTAVDIGSADDDDEIAMTTGLWKVPLETYVGWTDDAVISLDMHRLESLQLKRSICSKWPGSLYAAFLNSPEAIDYAKDNVYLDETGRSFILLANIIDEDPFFLPALENRELCSKAADFSALVALLHIRFNYVLAHAAENCPDDDITDSAWGQATDPSFVYLERALRCSPEESFALTRNSLGMPNSRNRKTLAFLKEAQACIKNNDLPTLDALIAQRERSLKGPIRAKIENAHLYVSDAAGNRAWFGGRELTYRLDYALTLAGEIVAPLGGDPR